MSKITEQELLYWRNKYRLWIKLHSKDEDTCYLCPYERESYLFCWKNNNFLRLFFDGSVGLRKSGKDSHGKFIFPEGVRTCIEWIRHLGEK
jgi:hypothetical protein